MVKLCMGSLAISPIARGVTQEHALSVVRAAYDGGAGIIDTAEYYRNYALLMPALAALPNMRVITKTYAYDETTAEASFGKARRELGRDYIDYFLLHEQESIHTLRGHAGAARFFRRKAGSRQIGRFGISTHRIEGVRAAVKYASEYGIGAVMAPLNMLGVGLSDGTLSEMIDALREAKAAGLDVFLMKALAGGHLISRRDEAFRFILEQDYADYCAIGMASAAEARYACAVFNNTAPSEGDAQTSLRADRRLMIEEGCIGCGACAERCGQRAIVMDFGKARAIADKCVQCGYCAAVCPELVIKIM
ncbi:MAG: aldo/keto reductase [Oscillospiraceae bacterium]|jgi:predicted aldo/keto reductase-like oxidoreductase|nr:aldo/keto reductase [Oscillospiraceae bacterium]